MTLLLFMNRFLDFLVFVRLKLSELKISTFLIRYCMLDKKKEIPNSIKVILAVCSNDTIIFF